MCPFLPASLEVWRGFCLLVGGSGIVIPTCHHFTVVQWCVTMDEWPDKSLFSLQVVCLCHNNISFRYPPSRLVFLYLPGSSWKGCTEWVITSGLEIAFLLPQIWHSHFPNRAITPGGTGCPCNTAKRVTWSDSQEASRDLVSSEAIGQDLSTKADLASHPEPNLL